MKDYSKILALDRIVVIIFWLSCLSSISFASTKIIMQDEVSQKANQDSITNRLKYPRNDSLAKILCDKTPPYFTDLNPDSGQKKVDRYSIIKFTVNDDNVTVGNWDTSGVDTGKIFISIKSRFLNVSSVKPDSIKLLNNKPFKVECIYHPRQAFDWSDTVTVKLDAWDLSYFRNHADTIYTFYTIRDTIAPVLTPIYPLPGDQNVPLSSTVIIQGTEIGRGIVLDSIKLWINDSLVSRTIKGDPWNFQIFYDSDSSWYFDQDIHVVCTAFDLDRNAGTLDYYFNTESPPDTSGPWFIDLIPAPEDTAVSRETSIKFTVVDDYLGVDVDSVFISITSRLQTMKKVRVDSFQIIDPCTVRFIYQPPHAFDWNDSVRIELLAYDLSQPAKPGDKTFIFYTVKDTTDKIAPVITVIRPKPNSTNALISTDIVLYVTDDLSGVDTSTVELKIDNQIIPHGQIQFINDGAGDTVRYQPLMPFEYNDSVDIYFKVADFKKNSADMRYYFNTKVDTIPPLIGVIRPLPGDTSVSVNTDIVIYVIDDLSGVDTSTIKLRVDSSLARPKIIPDPVGGDTVKFKPSDPFAYNSLVHVDFEVMDFVKNWAGISYWFKMPGPDTIPPLIEVIRPMPNRTNVPISTDIVLYVSDNLLGVDTSTVELKVDNHIIPHGQIQFFSDGACDTIRYQSVQPFAYNARMNIDFKVADFAKNSADTSYYFNTKVDTIPPLIEVIRPLPGDTNVSVTTNIVLYVKDDISGVDTSTIEFVVDKQVIPHSLIDFIKDGGGDTVKYRPPTPFPSDDQVDVYFKVLDFAANMMDTSYYFRTSGSQDTVPPLIEVVRPKPDTTNVPVMTDIRLYMTDNLSGVDTSKVELKVDNQIIPHRQIQFFNDGVGDTVRYLPLKLFAKDVRVDVYFKVADFAVNWADTSYLFKTEPPLAPKDNTPPMIEVIRPKPNEDDVPTTLDLVLYVTDNRSGVDTSTVELVVENQIIAHSILDFINDGVGDTVKYKPAIAFPKNSKIRIYFKVADFDSNLADTSYSFITGGAKLIVRSNPFTPNDDGFNDDAEFNFEQFDVQNPDLKIFDMHGKKVKEFVAETAINKSFVWKGLDDTGRALLPGVYLYIFSDRAKGIARGCIVIAK